MIRKTIMIEIVVEDELSIHEKRAQVREVLEDTESTLCKGLAKLGWSGKNYASTVSNPRRTAHFKI